MLQRMWRKVNPTALECELITMENSMEITLKNKTRNKTTI